MNISVKYDKTLAKFGILTLIEQYRRHFEDYDETKSYDVVFCIYASAMNVKAKHIVLLCAAQTIDNYMYVEGSEAFKTTAGTYTDVVLLRYVKDIYDKIVEDYHCNVFCKNFNLYDFSKPLLTKRRNAILHLGRLCNFKHSIRLVTDSAKYASKFAIDCYGDGLVDGDNFTAKAAKYSVTSKQIGNIKLHGFYKHEDVLRIASQYKYCICLYTADFSDNIEYAVLEMINAGCYLIANDDYIDMFEKTSCLGRLPHCIRLHANQSIDEAIANSSMPDVQSYVNDYAKFYSNDKIIQSILGGLI